MPWKNTRRPPNLPARQRLVRRETGRAISQRNPPWGSKPNHDKLREIYWIPRLRRLAKKVLKRCFGCRRFQAIPFPNPHPGKLPKGRTEGDLPFQVIGVDYAGPIRYRKQGKKESKAYIIVYACSLTRALYIKKLKR